MHKLLYPGQFFMRNSKLQWKIARDPPFSHPHWIALTTRWCLNNKTSSGFLVKKNTVFLTIWTDKKHIGYNLQVSINNSYRFLSGLRHLQKICGFLQERYFFTKQVSQQHAGTNLFIVLWWSAAENNQWHRFVPEASLNQIGYSFSLNKARVCLL